MSTRRQTIISILLPAIVSIIPAFFTYSQSMYEVRQKYRQVHTEAEAGYASLVTSVKELQDATKEQHDQLIKLQAYIAAMEQFLVRPVHSPTGLGARSGSATRINTPDPGVTLARVRPKTPEALDLTEPAADFDQAAKR